MGDLEESMRKEVDALIDITEEMDCLRETKDIIDELDIILAIFGEQISIISSWNEFHRNSPDPLAPSTSGIANPQPLLQNVGGLLDILNTRRSDIQELYNEANRVYSKVNFLFLLPFFIHSSSEPSPNLSRHSSVIFWT